MMLEKLLSILEQIIKTYGLELKVLDAEIGDLFDYTEIRLNIVVGKYLDHNAKKWVENDYGIETTFYNHQYGMSLVIEKNKQIDMDLIKPQLLRHAKEFSENITKEILD